MLMCVLKDKALGIHYFWIYIVFFYNNKSMYAIHVFIFHVFYFSI